MRDAILTKKWTVSDDGSGSIVVGNIFGEQRTFNGYIEQVIVRASSGGGADFDMEIRGDETSSSAEDLYYSQASASYPLTDSAIAAPFDTKNTEDGDLSIYLNPAASGTFEIRIDFRILGRVG